MLRAGLGLGDAAALGAPTGLPVVGFAPDGWLASLWRSDTRAFDAELEMPSTFVGSLRPYQARGVAWLRFLGGLGLGACLADDMGLGKSVQLLALLEMERASGMSAGPTLLVCPTSVLGNWQREAARFTPGLVTHVHHGPRRGARGGVESAAARADLVVTSYALVARDRAKLAAVEWGRVVLDEAQHVKNAAARTTQAVRSLPARERVALTGTPVENRLGELWSIFEFLNPGLLGSAASFRERFAVPIERYHDDAAASLLRRATGPFVLRRVKSDPEIVPDLPEKVEVLEHCTLTREQAALYKAVVDGLLDRLEGGVEEGMQRRGMVLAALTKLAQVCDHPALVTGDEGGRGLAGRSGKLARLEEVLETVRAEGDAALVFTRFARWGGMLANYLRARLGEEVLYLHGGTPRAQRDAMVGRFQAAARGAPRVFVLSLRAGGVGLNLTAASHVVHYDRWWNPAVEDQATDRAYRIGQHLDVVARKFVCAGTFEEALAEMIERKRGLAESSVGAGEAWLTELSTDELRSAVALGRHAVEED